MVNSWAAHWTATLARVLAPIPVAQQSEKGPAEIAELFENDFFGWPLEELAEMPRVGLSSKVEIALPLRSRGRGLCGPAVPGTPQSM